MNNIEFVTKAISIAENYKTSYAWGAFGMPASAPNMQRMINQYSMNTNYLASARQIYGKGFFFDCVGLIKGILWGWNGNRNDAYGGAKYASNGIPDYDADTMISICSNISTDFTNIQIGEVVWMVGHIGIYVGNGIVVESTPAWNSGVQKSALANIGSISGLNSRKWTKHGKLPYVEYVANEGGLTMTQYEELKSIIEKQQERLDSMSERLFTYQYMNDDVFAISTDAKEALDAAISKGIVGYGKNGFEPGLTKDMIRMVIWNYRAGIYN